VKRSGKRVGHGGFQFGALAYEFTNRYPARAMPFDPEAIKQRAAELAAKGVFIGTSSWKYEGWFGQLLFV